MDRETRERGEIFFSEMLERAERLAPEFEDRMTGIPYEEMGILFSEMLFLFAAVSPRQPERVVESGRARAQSTLMLARCFPSSRVVSIESDPETSDSVFGASRVAGLPNVELLSGDGKALLPEVVQEGDVVVVDGPKSYRAIALGLELLSMRRPLLVFLHDFYRDQAERRLLESLLPEAFFSDDRRFADRFAYLDESCWKEVREKGIGHWLPYTYCGRPAPSYGPTFACLPWVAGRPYAALADGVVREGFLDRARLLAQMRRGGLGEP